MASSDTHSQSTAMKYRTGIIGVAMTLAGAFAAGEGSAQRPTTTVQSSESTAFIPVIVTDDTRAHVAGLDRSTFTVREKSTVLPIVDFWGPGEAMSLVFVMDVSRSIHPEDLTRARRTLHAIFARTSAGSEFAVVGVSGPVLVSGWQSTSTALTGGMDVLQQIHQAGPAEGTALHDGIVRSLQLVSTSRFRRTAVIVISDGYDTRSLAPARDVERAIRRTSSLMYTLVTDRPSVVSGDNPIMKRVEVTGGRKFTVAKDKDWTTAADAITADLEYHYVLGVRVPGNPPDDKWHEIKVTLGDSPTPRTARSRTGYMRPSTKGAPK
jgi:VWFA-related protein